jgi:hypothetical protein
LKEKIQKGPCIKRHDFNYEDLPMDLTPMTNQYIRIQ